MPKTFRPLLLASAVLLAAGVVHAQDPLAAAFKSPPNSARPRVWWHWMNANVTQHGIDEDFAWMKRVGIAGVQMRAQPPALKAAKTVYAPAPPKPKKG